MRNDTVARRYAKALFELAVETKTIEDVLQGMSNIDIALKNAPQLNSVLLNPLVTPAEKTKLIKTITSNKLILKFIDLLARRKRMDLLSASYDFLLGFYDETNDLHRILVKTAHTLTETQKKMVEKTLTQKLGGTIIGKFEVAKDLIGGVWVKMGDKVLDTT
ncbi:ATP synthase F1 subunit delta, partial [bacterium F11]